MLEKIYSVTDPEFTSYGRVLKGFDLAEICREAETIPHPAEGSSYQASVEAFEKLKIAEELQNACYGTLPMELGFCWGHSCRMNAMEYHSSNELNIAVTPMVLILGHTWDVKDGWVDSAAFRAFLIPQGTVLEVFASTLHFCPCQTTKDGFRCVVGLPKGTNLPLEKPAADPLLFRQNKWLIAHVDNSSLIARGAVAGITGENYEVPFEE